MKKCTNGHYYADELEQCPYCPSGAQSGSYDKNSENSSSSPDKTQVFGGGGEKTGVIPKGNVRGTVNASNNDAESTIISIPLDNTSKKNIQRAKKKLVGWLISYTIDEMGIDFRLYEGKNVIGSKAGCNITVLNDKSVSGEHATILFRGGVFMIKDEFSTNGTFLNDKILINETPTIKDGDIIKTGDTIFKFKSAL